MPAIEDSPHKSQKKGRQKAELREEAGRWKNGRWKKGFVANPRGRPPIGGTMREVARQHGPEALAVLLRVMRQTNDLRAAVSAANAMLDRGYGKPAQTLHVTEQSPMEMTDAELLEAIREASGPGGADDQAGGEAVSYSVVRSVGLPAGEASSDADSEA